MIDELRGWMLWGKMFGAGFVSVIRLSCNYFLRRVLRDINILTVPISRGLNDGISYPVNPRFDADGRWRRSSEWPLELQ
jgi:hypothetical protein